MELATIRPSKAGIRLLAANPRCPGCERKTIRQDYAGEGKTPGRAIFYCKKCNKFLWAPVHGAAGEP